MQKYDFYPEKATKISVLKSSEKYQVRKIFHKDFR